MTEDSGLLHLSEVSIAETKKKKIIKSYTGKPWLGKCYDQEILHGNEKFCERKKKNLLCVRFFFFQGGQDDGGEKMHFQSFIEIQSCAESRFTITESPHHDAIFML